MSMWNQIGKSFLIATVAFVAVSCGDKETDPVPSAPPPQNGDPTNPPAGSTGKCTVATPGANTVVYWSGTKGAGTVFPDVDADYIGKIVSMYSTAGQFYVIVDWDLLSENKVHTFSSDTKVMPVAKCEPDLSGRDVVYVGTQDGSDPKFPSAGTVYLGKIVNIYAGSFAEIDWDHLTEHTVEPFTKIALQAK